MFTSCNISHVKRRQPSLIMLLLVDLQVESVVTAIVDLFPDYLRVGRRREILVGAVCLIDFAIGCTMVMQV